MLFVANKSVANIDELGNSLGINDLYKDLSQEEKKTLLEIISNKDNQMKMYGWCDLPKVKELIVRYKFMVNPTQDIIARKSVDRKGLTENGMDKYKKDYYEAYKGMLKEVERVKEHFATKDVTRIFDHLWTTICCINLVSTSSNGLSGNGATRGNPFANIFAQEQQMISYSIAYFQDRQLYNEIVRLVNDKKSIGYLSVEQVKNIITEKMGVKDAIGIGWQDEKQTPIEIKLEGVPGDYWGEQKPELKKRLYTGYGTTLRGMKSPTEIYDRDKKCVDKFKEVIEKIRNTEWHSEEKLEAIGEFCHCLDRYHIFREGNTRTANIVLDLLLLSVEEMPSFIADPNLIEGTCPKMLIPIIKEGQNYCKSVIAK